MSSHFILDPTERHGQHEIHLADAQCRNPGRPNMQNAINLYWQSNMETAKSYARSHFVSWNIGVCPTCASQH